MVNLIFLVSNSTNKGAETAAVCGFGSIALLCYMGMMLFYIAMFAITIGGLIFWIFMLVDVAKRPDDAFPNPGPNTKLSWVLIVALANWIGAIIYYFIVKRKMEEVAKAMSPE